MHVDSLPVWWGTWAWKLIRILNEEGERVICQQTMHCASIAWLENGWYCLIGAEVKVTRQERLVWGSQTWESKFLGIQFRFLNQALWLRHYGNSYLREQLKSGKGLFRLLVSGISCFYGCEHLTRQKVSPNSHWPGCREPERKGPELFKGTVDKIPSSRCKAVSVSSPDVPATNWGLVLPQCILGNQWIIGLPYRASVQCLLIGVWALLPQLAASGKPYWTEMRASLIAI